MSSVPKQVVADLCKKWGEKVSVPEGIDGAQLLWAIAGNESSFGADCGPRFEQSYYTGSNSHSLVQKNLNAKYAEPGASSYGPWQLMLANFGGLDPQQASDPENGVAAAVKFLNGYVFGHWNCKTLEQIGQCYNGGHPGASVPEYVARLEKHYAVPMP